MSNDEMTDWFLLERYIAREATPAERAVVEQWLATQDNGQHTLMKVQAALAARHHQRSRDWQRAEAIETVVRRVRAGDSEVSVAAPSRQTLSLSAAAERLLDRIRHWFDGATELAAAMLLDSEDEAMTDEDVTVLRDKIDDAKRGNP